MREGHVKEVTKFCRIRPSTNKTLLLYANAHGWNMPQFLDVLATIIRNGLDDFDNLTLEEAKTLYSKSCLAVYQNMKMLFVPIEPKKEK